MLSQANAQRTAGSGFRELLEAHGLTMAEDGPDELSTWMLRMRQTSLRSKLSLLNTLDFLGCVWKKRNLQIGGVAPSARAQKTQTNKTGVLLIVVPQV